MLLLKIEQFLKSISEKVQYNTEIHLPTLKLVLKLFYKFLSEKQKIRWKLTVDMLTSITSTQISLDKALSKIKTDTLENELNNLKENNEKN